MDPTLMPRHVQAALYEKYHHPRGLMKRDGTYGVYGIKSDHVTEIDSLPGAFLQCKTPKVPYAIPKVRSPTVSSCLTSDMASCFDLFLSMHRGSVCGRHRASSLRVSRSRGSEFNQEGRLVAWYAETTLGCEIASWGLVELASLG